MSTKKTPTITQRTLKERGAVTFIVICPGCNERWEEIPGYPSKCISCEVAPIPWTTFDKHRRMAEIDLMPTKIFINYLSLLTDVQLEKKNIETVNFLIPRIHMLRNAMYSYVNIDESNFKKGEKLT